MLARGYSDPAYRGPHQPVVDAYNCQHPAEHSHRAVQSVAVYLITLRMFLEDGVDPHEGPASTRTWPTGRSSPGVGQVGGVGSRRGRRPALRRGVHREVKPTAA
ncbi:DUF5946 family protein [Streptomyces inhibens]|uniref:DUF5946 family protein n=1 Tax=Streptomyces inhibens TaxID=2293571 RepID=UPI0036B1F0C7